MWSREPNAGCRRQTGPGGEADLASAGPAKQPSSLVPELYPSSQRTRTRRGERSMLQPGSSGSGREAMVLRSEINVTPLVDVCLVLLIIFIVITPMLRQGITVALPKTANPSRIPEVERQLTLSIRRSAARGSSAPASRTSSCSIPTATRWRSCTSRPRRSIRRRPRRRRQGKAGRRRCSNHAAGRAAAAGRGGR